MFTISDDVARALKNNEAVVALESTLITHGLPKPRNVETALAAEAIVRSEGATPATIAIIDGVIRIGLSKDEIEWLGSLEAGQVLKVSRAELPFVISKKRHASTTVAATMVCAKRAGISVFATGGIGGVHRGAEVSMDISADISELARTDVVVVCAGAKSILDIGLTLEVLESEGVSVLGFGVQNFPAFYHRDSGFALTMKVDNAAEVAAFMSAKESLGLSGGVLVANPVPAEAAMQKAEVESLVEDALAKAHAKGISGKAVTPYLLSEINTFSGGRSVACNMALIKNNALVAAQIAQKMASPRGFEPLLLP